MAFRGVNLGGWLVPERWITPTLFKYYEALSEPDLYSKAKTKSLQPLNEHFSEYINEGDFVYLNTVGIDAVRLPISHGVFGDMPPIPSTLEYVDFVIETADKFDIRVLLDVHTAMQSQNGWEKGGKQGKIAWHTSQESIDQSVDVVNKLAKRYKHASSLYGIEVLNEPHAEIPLKVLKQFYLRCYNVIREQCSEEVAVVICDAFRPLAWHDFMNEPAYKNVVLDMHLYQCFAPADKKMTILEHFAKTTAEWGSLIDKVQQHKQAICGEWSLALDDLSFEGLTAEERRWAIRDYGKVQLETFEKLSGWFYWTYKMPYRTAWSFRSMVENSFLS